ncbi:MAG: SLBB domain-containing protein [Planctomycetes bacterium]|nr:SLBB domain-containing protein [Planctomycetota bacterium]MCB9868816.1 SLBB domain-containing protein [Planctomycetota bacterium]
MTPAILLTRPSDAPRQSLAEYREEHGYVALTRALAGDPEAVLGAVESSGLRGRGGASFPAAVKWRLAASTAAETRFVVANGGEHEPGSEKDKLLVARYPHKVLEGLLLCGFATGATKGFLYLIEDMTEQIDAATQSIEELRDAGLLGAAIAGSGFAFDIEIHRAPPTYVAGEETAAIGSIDGGPAKPRKKPPYPGEAGIRGCPTTVNNVETLAHVPSIVRLGAEWYRGIGTEQSTGTMLFTLDSRVQRPGVYELPFGSTFRDVIYGCGGGPRSGRAIRAILPALSCGFLGAEHLDTAIDHATLRALGTSVGCGGISFVEEGDDVLQRVSEIAAFFMKEQCGQCPPCRMETNQIAHVLAGVRAGKGPGYAAQIEKVTAFARGKGHCSLIEMAAAPVLSALRLFADDFAAAAGPGAPTADA